MKLTQVTSAVRINAPKEKVWEVLADLGTVSVWNPTIASSHYTSGKKEGVGASRHCDFPDGGYVEEQVTQWDSATALKLQVNEGTVPFDNFGGGYTLSDDDDGTVVHFDMEYTVKPGTPVDREEVERQNRDELIPLILAGLKHFVETGEPLPTPEGAQAASS